MDRQKRPIRLLQDILRENVAQRPDKLALICERQRLTYAQINEMSDRLASAFCQYGVKTGDRVLFYLMNGVELVVGIFAALKANAVFVVVDYANKADTLAEIAQNCQATAVVTHYEQRNLSTELLKCCAHLRVAILTGGATPTSGDSNFLSFQRIQEEFPAQPPAASRIDADLAYLIYTSGSTGHSKGVMVTHRSSLFTVNSGVEYLCLSADDIHTSPLPLSFSPGINQLFQTFLAGGTLILEKSFTFPVMTFRRMAAEQATGFAGVPTILALLLQMDLKRYDLSNLRYITSIGAALAPQLIGKIRQQLPHVSLFSTYGMAEASYSLGLDPNQIDERPTSVGKPFPGTQAWIIGEDGQPLGANQMGELVVRGGHVRSGYWGDPQNSARRFRPGSVPGETVCYTGDVFRTDEEGYFYFVGRSDEIIKSGAKKVAPKEIENALHGLPGVLETAAIGVADPLLGQVIKAFVVLDGRARDSFSVQDILKHCYQTLEDYKVPRYIEIRESLPKTPSGKIIKTDLV